MAGGYSHFSPTHAGQTAWNYYLDDNWHIPAPTLDISIDESGIVSGWGFTDGASKLPLSIRQTVAEADRERETQCDYTPRIVFGEVIRPGFSSDSDIRFGLGVPQLTSPAGVEGHSVWSYYVRKPSPLRRLALRLEIEFGRPQFDPQGNLVGVVEPDRVYLWSFQGSGYGCPAM